MDKQRCRFLLRACRPNGADASDPAMREAIEQARLDPRLSAWFDREQRADAALAARLSEIHAPTDLRDQILAGVAISAQGRNWRTWPMALSALAASIALVAGFLAVRGLRATPPSFDTVVASAYDVVHGSVSLAYYSESLPEVSAWLDGEHVTAPATLPAILRESGTIGCRTFDWNGMPASLVCFRVRSAYRDGTGQPIDVVMHLFTVERRRCTGGPACTEPMVFTKDDSTVATWRDEERFYVLVTQCPEPHLQRLLRGETATSVASRPATPAGTTTAALITPTVI